MKVLAGQHLNCSLPLILKPTGKEKIKQTNAMATKNGLPFSIKLVGPETAGVGSWL
jgi:hypothetical protein